MVKLLWEKASICEGIYWNLSAWGKNDKAHLHLNGFVNKQNFRYWELKNPIIWNEKDLHPQCVTVVHNYVRPHYWPILIWKLRKLYRDSQWRRYRDMLNTILRLVVIHLRNRHELWFQLDGATYHTANETIDVLQGMFGNNIIYCRAAPTCPPKSPGINAPDYYLWRYLKERIHR